ncbi:MAG: BMP family ABC transporter substrate-binding protein [Deltaproteobacteria bacterium]|nr:BMP family ABC transporter substrate-binding protein [Deltaproteobacteria bacterium]
MRLGFIYSSSQNDKGWSQTHHDAALAIAESLGVEMAFRPSVVSADVAGVIDDLVETDDANVIFTISSGFITETLNAANKYPDRYFISCCGDVSGDNLTSYFGRMYQPIYVLGYVAGSMSCTGQLGVVAALPLPQFVRHINAFTLGAKEANPDIQVDVRWVGAFFDPEVEGAMAEELIAAGSDVIFAQSNSTAPIEAQLGATVACTDPDSGEESEVPIYRIGYHSPTACESNPDQCLSSAYWEWTDLYEKKVQSIRDGTFDPTDTAWASMTNDSRSVVNYAAFPGSVPIAVTTGAEERRGRTIADPQVPFRGPIVDNTGATQIAEGQDLSDAELDEMCWFVDGVISTESGSAVAGEVPSSCGGI